jgi:hypothetical protein
VATAGTSILTAESHKADLDSASRRRSIWSVVALAGVIVLPFALVIPLYFNTLHAGFLWDDFGWLDMGQSLRATGWGYFRPLTTLDFHLDELLFGQAAWGYHLENVLLHATNTLLVAFLALAMGYRARVALLSIPLFALHGSHWDAVTIVAGRPTLTGAVLLLASLILLFLGFQARVRWPLLVLSLITFLLALLAKESAFFFPVAAAFLLIFFFRRGRLDRAIYLAGTILTLLLYLSVDHLVNGAGASSSFTLSSDALGILFEFFRMLAVPTQWAGDLPFQTNEILAIPILAGFAAIWAILVWRGDRRRVALLSLALLALLLSAPLYGAARLLYVPLIFLAILAADLISTLFSLRIDRRLLAPAALVLFVGLGSFLAWHTIERRERDRSIWLAANLVDNTYAQMLALVPNPAPGAAIKFVNLPGWGPGAYPFRTFGGTTTSAVHWLYGRADISPVTNNLDYVSAPGCRWDLGDPTHRLGQKVYIFTYQDGSLRVEEQE